MSRDVYETCATPAFGPFAGVSAACRGTFLRFLNRLAVWGARRESRRRLAGMDDHLLRDIGVSRAEAVAESDKPFWRA